MRRKVVSEGQTTEAFVAEVRENIAFGRWLFSRLTKRRSGELKTVTAQPRVNDPVLSGQIDIVVEFQTTDMESVTVHIEDKINARETGADQFDRYRERKQRYEKNTRSVITTIVAPSRYLSGLTTKKYRYFDEHVSYEDLCREVRDSSVWKEGIQKHADGFVQSEYHTTWRSNYQDLIQEDGNSALKMCTPAAGFGGNKITYEVRKRGLHPEASWASSTE